MTDFFSATNPPFIATLLALAMSLAWAVAWWVGRKKPADPDDRTSARFIDSSLALMGLLLGFTFAMALGKYEQRRLLLITDANGIADFYTCAALLPDDVRPALQHVIRDYLDVRLRWASHALPAEDAVRESLRLQSRMTDLCAQAVRAGTPIAVPLVNTLNNLTSNHSSLIAAMRDRLPMEVTLLLAATALVSTVLVGRNHGRYNRLPLTGTLSYILLVSAAVLVVLDLNHPRAGFITLQTEPLQRLADSLAP